MRKKSDDPNGTGFNKIAKGQIFPPFAVTPIRIDTTFGVY